MKALAIDTTNLVMGTAVIDGNQIIGELITNLKKNHSVRLMPAVQQLLEEVEVKPNELERIIVANGPGSYTGVRIGVTVAKTLAWSLNIPIVGVSSLEVLAQNGRYFQGYVVPLFDARRGQIYTGLYGMKNGKFQNIEEDKILLSSDWAKQLQNLDQPVLFLGNDLPLHQEHFKGLLGEKAVFGKVSEHNPRPSELAALGIERKPADDVHTFIPNYIRLAEAEANWLASQKK
ncbi:tRNA (adenosine(37)-N6)-threonylcarbamoyltransferase complex dimerization subunit type 1 TsaB [Bacillus taeanensis]|uniref:tRNA (Adenosine(37)-N6)-threonylcarbamoyltransferase complex dimerization subunit type 1 TsaB n=1 Tax=Bacillus taeanensis TaxID=273032 RepID=A0A366XTU4_9BACI|nr:tRNA (adenosine(37)-N6)-threonylcarbamoyltransferase complex dimerization subunit type 1 TsaB [Bacillus taeanensis]RBW67573.1 tRNA (adenosine(37)-N6)-threonylcarbamoyltransferase complex dimerization subunit type 1 TsaB [Bacillus taeanensis]